MCKHAAEGRTWLCKVASSYVHIFLKGELIDLNNNSLALSDVWNPEAHTLQCMKTRSCRFILIAYAFSMADFFSKIGSGLRNFSFSRSLLL